MSRRPSRRDPLGKAGVRLRRALREAEEANEHKLLSSRLVWSGATLLPPGFYVYELIDPRTDEPFYVGKGQRRRAWDHERGVRAGTASGCDRKNAMIRAIVDAGHAVVVRIVACYELEADALEHEYRLIEARRALTNIMPGGMGRAATPIQVVQRQRRRELQRLESRVNGEHQQAVSVLRSEFASAGRTTAERDEIERWLSGVASETHAPRLASSSPSRLASKRALEAFRAAKPTA